MLLFARMANSNIFLLVTTDKIILASIVFTGELTIFIHQKMAVIKDIILLLLFTFATLVCSAIPVTEPVTAIPTTNFVFSSNTTTEPSIKKTVFLSTPKKIRLF